MSITIPQGGTVAGRSASITGLDQQPDIGGTIATVASGVAEKYGQIKAQQRAVVVEQTRLDMTKELGEERLRFEQMTDPAQIEAEWPAVQAAIRDKYVNGKDANGQPLLSSQEADALGLTLQDLGMKHGFALGERTIKLTDAQANAAWLTARTDIANSAATADPDTMAALIDYGEAAIDRLPGMLPDQAVKEKQAFRAEVANARLTGAITADPAAALAALNAGVYDALGAEVVAQRKATAQGEIDRIAAADAKLAEAEVKKQTDAAARRLGTIADLTAKGRKVPDRDFVLNAPDSVKALPEWAEAMAAIQLDDELPALRTMTLPELDKIIAAEKDREIVHEWENQRLTVLEGMREKLATETATDPKAAAIARGVIAPEGDLDFDPADPGSFAAGLAEAISQDTHLRDKGYVDGNRSALFTLEQKNGLKAVLAPGAEAGPKVALASAILEGTGGNVAPVLADLEADPVFRRTVKVLGLTRDPALAESILRGQQKLDGKTVIAPSRKDQLMAFDAMTGGVFDDAPALKAELMEAALSLYADGARGIDGETQATAGDWLADGAAYTLYGQSLQRLLGAQADRNGALTVGGVQEVNGGLTVLPMGVGVQDVEATWDVLTDHLNGVVYDAALNSTGDMAGADPSALRESFAAPIPKAGDPLRAFRAASKDVGGGVPELGSNPGARFATLTMRRVEESDVYELMYERDGRLQAVTVAGQDYAYRFRLKDLMRGAKP